MFKKLAIFAVAALIAGTAFAQQTRDTAQDLLKTAGIEIEIPESATQEQIDQILAIINTGGGTTADKEGQVKQVLGM